jgi:membrane fusion protein, heavy metal efflux system
LIGAGSHLRRRRPVLAEELRMKALFYASGVVVTLLFVACQHSHDEKAPADETVSITKWTEKTELFVEFAPLLAGKETPFAAHLTDLETFEPIAQGTLRVSFTPAQGKEIIAEVKSPTAAGIYRPVAKIDQPGSYRLAFYRYRPGSAEIYDTIDAGEVKVLGKPEAPAQTAESPQPKKITFLKEQQWRMDFATEPVRERELSPVLKISAEVKPAAAGQVQITAPIAGRILLAGRGALVPGQKIKQGEVLAVISPLPKQSKVELAAEFGSAKAELEAAERELERVQDLYKDKIVARRRLEQTERDVAVQKSRLNAVRSQLGLLDSGQSAPADQVPLRAPIAGTIVAINLTPGAQIEAGQNLLSIIDMDRVWIEGRLFELDISKVRQFDKAWFSAPALLESLALVKPQARLLNIGNVIDPATRSVPIVLEVQNGQGQLRIGLQGDLSIPTGERSRGLAVPLSAIVDDKGISAVFVQAEGESFERRELELGIRSDGYAEVKSGLKPGERVVTKGGYRVHLASLSTTLPAHGHAH